MGNVFSCCLPEVAEGEIVYVERHQLPSAPPASPSPPPPTPPPAYDDILADIVEDMEEAMVEEDRTVRVVREFVEAQRDLCDAHDALLRSIAASLENVL
jgi:hypothetical protein